MNRGYAGYNNGVFLRSSYEYAYAKYLDFNKVEWKYEVQSFDLGHKIYKPDFFIYSEEGSLINIIEIKSKERMPKKLLNSI
ncbi:hypothetical protein ACFSO7_18895 [Bacillus sp. CGMCC 1.16607]|uniref:hypothetical protein n=1 Tax=Bacillus sp. CGMCC 1.16607 TaxID=3351842 RepID=UPI00363D77F7